jgi:alkylation response protein AidB-like acyl-CoA dehydrogenase
MAISSEEQRLLRESAVRLVREISAQSPPTVRDPTAVWTSAIDMGWPALAFEEADGGLSGAAPDICALVSELGRGLLVGSYIVGTVLPGRLVAAAPPGTLRTALLEGLLSGSRSLAFADTERPVRGPGSGVATSATRAGEGWTVEGAKTNVWSDERTRTLLVSAKTGGPKPQELLLIVPVDAVGLSVRSFKTVDGGQALECTFWHLAVPQAQVLMPPEAGVRELRERAWELARTAMVAECVGMMLALIERTAQYLHSRRQFGQPLASFQALRHRMADMALACRRAEALGERAAREFALLEPRERTRLIAAACVKALGGARFVAEQAVQLHGGMGMSAEVPIGRYLRRVLALEATFGAAEHHRARFLESEAGLPGEHGR